MVSHSSNTINHHSRSSFEPKDHTELLNDNVVPTLNSQKVTGVTTGSALVPAVDATTKDVVVMKADSTSETVMVTPNTGDNLAFVIPVMVGVVALVILGAGVVIIKKKTL